MGGSSRQLDQRRHYALETVSHSAEQPPPPGFSSQQRTAPKKEEARDEEPAEKRTESASKQSKQTDVPKSSSKSPEAPGPVQAEKQTGNSSLPPGWEDDPDWNITSFEQLPHRMLGTNQHMRVNEDFKRSLQSMLWQFRAPIRYTFAYGSGVFAQNTVSSSSSSYNPATSPHPNPPEAIVKWQQGGGKMIDMIFGVSHTQHWHSLNLQQHRDHYSFLGSLGSGLVSRVQDQWGAGVYFNPYITLNGTMIKYGVVNLDTLARDLSTWDTLYMAGRLQKPVKILRDDPRIRLGNQINLISAVRVALLMLPEKFTERQLFMAIAGISYMGDPRMRFYAENPKKVKNIVEHQLPNFRRLYAPLIQDLPNAAYTDVHTPDFNWLNSKHDCTMQQNMDPVRRGNMVRRLPSAFREKLYFLYRGKFGIPGRDFAKMLEASKDEDDSSFRRREGTEFDRRIAVQDDLREMVGKAIQQTVAWPSTSQSIKSFFTAGVGKSRRYFAEKRDKSKQTTTEARHKEESKSD